MQVTTCTRKKKKDTYLYIYYMLQIAQRAAAVGGHRVPKLAARRAVLPQNSQK